jgi:hypothetical protein
MAHSLDEVPENQPTRAVSVPARTESWFANVAWHEALTIPHSLLDCADEVIEYQNVMPEGRSPAANFAACSAAALWLSQSYAS